MRNYLQEKFDIGNTTGHKSDPVQVSVDMRCARDEQDRRLFTASECLQAQQIRSFFSRLAAAKTANVQNPADLKEKDIQDLESDFEAEQYETEMQQLRQDVAAEVTERHPIYYERFNLCDLGRKNKLTKFNIDMLVRICGHFELNIANVSRKGRRVWLPRSKS